MDAKRCGKGRNRGKGKGKSGQQQQPRPRKKPTFKGGHDKVKHVVADEPRLEPLSSQLEKLKKEIQVHAKTDMNQCVADALKTLKHFNFDESLLKPAAVDSKECTTCTAEVTKEATPTAAAEFKTAPVVDKCEKASLMAI